MLIYLSSESVGAEGPLRSYLWRPLPCCGDWGLPRALVVQSLGRGNRFCWLELLNNKTAHLFIYLSFFTAAPAAYGSSQARGPIRAEAAAYVTAMPDPSRICDLHCSLWQHGLLNPLSKATDQTHIHMSSWILVRFLTRWTTTGTPKTALESTSVRHLFGIGRHAPVAPHSTESQGRWSFQLHRGLAPSPLWPPSSCSLCLSFCSALLASSLFFKHVMHIFP